MNQDNINNSDDVKKDILQITADTIKALEDMGDLMVEADSSLARTQALEKAVKNSDVNTLVEDLEMIDKNGIQKASALEEQSEKEQSDFWKKVTDEEN